jgi:proton-dependent oligopeptide transporter, POT family
MMITKNSRSPFHRSFYIANTMEIFERLAWYGMYTLLANYVMTPLSQGGLGLANAERGLIMGLVPFFLYLFPVISGALADRFGYRKMFILAFSIMAPSYFLLSFAKDLWSFIAIFMLVALGAGIFKPVVTGTIARTTDDSNRGLGFGIFYMMVNIGGFLGPLIAPIIQKHFGWNWVFIIAALWISLNFIPAIFFYQEPARNNHKKRGKKTLKQVFAEVQQVLGNARLAFLVVPLLILLLSFYAGFIRDGQFTLIVAICWLVIALLWDLLNKKSSTKLASKTAWYQQPMQLGNKPFMIYLLILTGFWTVYLQIFITFPLYVRDFIDTSDLVHFLKNISPWLYDALTNIDINMLNSELLSFSKKFAVSFEHHNLTNTALVDIQQALKSLDLRVPIAELAKAIPLIATDPILAMDYSKLWAVQYRQMNPATILSLDFLMIIVLQIFISRFIDKYNTFKVLIAGTAILSFALLLNGFANNFAFAGLLVATSVMVFAVGEMTASPKSQEYVASFAPKDKVAMFMGYYFVSMALGNLFAGLLSGWLYGWLASDLKQPSLLWLAIAALGFITCLALFVFNKALTHQLTDNANSEDILTEQKMITQDVTG